MSTAIQFPDYGKLLVEGFKSSSEPNILATQMESGPEKEALLGSQIKDRYQVTYQFTAAQYVVWLNWHKSVLGNGLAEFFWKDPRSNKRIVVSIEGGKFDVSPVSDSWDNIRVSFTLRTYR
jgi:hypothetical protein